VRYQLGNQLGSCVLEVDNSLAAQVISYEEYHPFGTTALWLGRGDIEVSDRRYRYTGKEKDEETGLYYHGARYYAPWLARWTSADPTGTKDGTNVYTYVRNNPVVLFDPDGRESSGWTRFWGAIQMIGGAAQTGTGIVVAVQIEVPVAAQIAGAAAMVHGMDDMSTGAAKLITGEDHKTNTHKTAAGAAEFVTDDKVMADKFGAGVDLAAGFISPAPASGGISGGAKLVPALVGGAKLAPELATAAKLTPQLLADTNALMHWAMANASMSKMQQQQQPSSSSSSSSGSSGSSSDPTTPPAKSMSDKLKPSRARARKDAVADLWRNRQEGTLTERDIHTLTRLEELYGAEAVSKFDETGKLPKDFEFSHQFSAAEYPEFSGKSELGVITDAREHRFGHHGGNTNEPLHGSPRSTDWESTGFQIVDDTEEGLDYAGMVCQ
jgi:RHS repeat-associated protein